jgi:(1->4)-alpha-D-glucan 1-alpha-D-glucosylmutase
MEKAVREAKVHTSWTQPDADYEEAVAAFVSAILVDDTFTVDLAAFVDEIKEAGWVNGLAQTLLRLTSPGVPDIYQGTELWDLSLVDPDNRRPVDYALRRHLLNELETLSPEAIWARADEGLPKLWLIRQALALRAQCPHLFGAESSYRPIDLPGADRLIAYAQGEEAIVLAPRFVLREGRTFPGVHIDLPGGAWRNVLTGESAQGRVAMDTIFARFPVALLRRE